MMLRSCLVALAMLSALGDARAVTDTCPAPSTEGDAIAAALRAAPSCDRAMQLFRACEYGASPDVQFGAVVEQKCEADFLSGLGASRKKAYAAGLARCDAKYANESGTMYRSFTAFCRAEVSQRYSRDALKAGPKAMPKAR